MYEHYPPILANATPDDVLAVLRDQHRQRCRYDLEADPDVVLGRDSTIAEWREACDLVPWQPLAEAINAVWEIDVPLGRWRAVLEPAKVQTLGGVCDLLARHAKLPRVRPARLLGRECLAAGVFLTVRSCLAAEGADVRELAPSTPLADYTRRYPNVFLETISQLAPGALPPVDIRRPVYHVCLLVLGVSGLGMSIGLCSGLHTLTVLFVFATGFAYLGTRIAARCMPPASVEFQGLKTFRDLCTVLAAGARRGDVT